MFFRRIILTTLCLAPLFAKAADGRCWELFQAITRSETWWSSNRPSRATELHTHLAGILPYERLAYLYVNEVYRIPESVKREYRMPGARDAVDAEKRILLKRIFELMFDPPTEYFDPATTPGVRNYLESLPLHWNNWRNPAFWRTLPEHELNSVILRVSRAMPGEVGFDEIYRINGGLRNDMEANRGQRVQGKAAFDIYMRYTLDYLREYGVDYAEISLNYGLFNVRNRFPSGSEPWISPFGGVRPQDGLRIHWLMGITNNYLWRRQTPRGSPMPEQVLAHIARLFEERPDVRGVDIFGGEGRRFSQNVDAFERFEALYDTLARRARRDRKLVYRIHVGEGAAFDRGVSGDGSHREVARDNIESVLNWLERLQGERTIDYSSSNVIFRLGHFTWATTEQVKRAARLGVYLEFPLFSNLVTGSLTRPERGQSVFDNHPLLLAVYHQARFVLATDGATVAHTTMESELQTMARILNRFVSGEIAIEVDRGVFRRYAELDPAERSRFDNAFTTLNDNTNAYRRRMGLAPVAVTPP